MLRILPTRLRQTLFLLSFLFPMAAFTQCPSVAGFITHATKIQPGLWIADTEVSVRDYERFLYYVLTDSGEAMHLALNPPKEFYCLDMPYSRNVQGPYYGRVLPVEVHHPMVGITQEQARHYCAWHSAFTWKMQAAELGPNDTNYWRIPPVRFRLPTPEEWALAAKMAQSPKEGATYKETPSRYLFTRTVTSARPGEKQLHFWDNVSEMTSDTAFVMGGNYEYPSLSPRMLSGLKPDLRMGFRMVLELPDSAIPFFQKPPRHGIKTCNQWFAVRDNPEKMDHHKPYKHEYYPYNLTQYCREISPDIWMSKTEVTVSQYAYYLYYTMNDSGELAARNQAPDSANIPGDYYFYPWDSLKKYLPQQGDLPVKLITVTQANAFCKWMTIHHRLLESHPGVPLRYWFRLPTLTEYAMATKLDPTIQPKDPAQGFRYIVEVMPNHPDARHFKAVPVYQVKGPKGTIGYKWNGF